MDPALVALLRSDLLRAEYTESAVTALLGEAADSARVRGVSAPARIALANRPPAAGSPEAALHSLIRLFLIGDPVLDLEVAGAFPELGMAGALALGIVTRARDDETLIRASLGLAPFHATGPGIASQGADWWLLSDLDDHIRRGPARPDHVMGVGGATRSLLGFAMPGRVATALDLGTGCGVIALHLAGRADRVIAVDISQRALDFALANTQLNEIHGIELRRGDLFAPVEGERFDLILSNPPFVITPRGSAGPTYDYRDGGKSGDELIEQVLHAAPAHLAPGGTLQCLGNWEVRWGEEGLDRVLEWVANAQESTPADACWVIERDRQRPEEYAELWARDGGARPGSDELERLVTAWLEDFATRRVIAIGLGFIGIRRAMTGDTRPVPRRAERADGAIGGAERFGDVWTTTFANSCQLDRLDSADFGRQTLVRDSAVREERIYEPGQEDPMSIVLANDAGISRRVQADTVLSAALGACDGDLTVDEIGMALSALLSADPVALREALHEGLRELVWCAMLHPEDSSVGTVVPPESEDRAN